jgi:hypothetical protein
MSCDVDVVSAVVGERELNLVEDGIGDDDEDGIGGGGSGNCVEEEMERDGQGMAHGGGGGGKTGWGAWWGGAGESSR